MTRKVRAASKEKTLPVEIDVASNPVSTVLQPTDLTTFDPEEYVQGVYAGIQDAMGEADLYSVACALDMSLDTLLQVVSHVEGPVRAREFAQKYLQTALPYASYQLGTKTTYAQLRDMRAKKD
jgi:hypothetical protein